MDVKEIGRIGVELKRFMREFAECFGRREPSGHAGLYVRSQLSNLPRKSMEPMADQAGIEPRALQKFLSLHQWDDGKMVHQTHAIVARDHAHSRQYWNRRRNQLRQEGRQDAGRAAPILRGHGKKGQLHRHGSLGVCHA